MTSLTKLAPILENRIVKKKLLVVVSRLNGGNSVKTNRPMVTAEEVSLRGSEASGESDNADLEVPTTCCMSGCANCVWIQYAEKLSEKIMNSDGDIQKIIMEKVKDPNMRAFLSMELRCRNLSK